MRRPDPPKKEKLLGVMEKRRKKKNKQAFNWRCTFGWRMDPESPPEYLSAEEAEKLLQKKLNLADE